MSMNKPNHLSIYDQETTSMSYFVNNELIISPNPENKKSIKKTDSYFIGSFIFTSDSKGDSEVSDSSFIRSFIFTSDSKVSIQITNNKCYTVSMKELWKKIYKKFGLQVKNTDLEITHSELSGYMNDVYKHFPITKSVIKSIINSWTKDIFLGEDIRDMLIEYNNYEYNDDRLFCRLFPNTNIKPNIYEYTYENVSDDEKWRFDKCLSKRSLLNESHGSQDEMGRPTIFPLRDKTKVILNKGVIEIDSPVEISVDRDYPCHNAITTKCTDTNYSLSNNDTQQSKVHVDINNNKTSNHQVESTLILSTNTQQPEENSSPKIINTTPDQYHSLFQQYKLNESASRNSLEITITSEEYNRLQEQYKRNELEYKLFVSSESRNDNNVNLVGQQQHEDYTHYSDSGNAD